MIRNVSLTKNSWGDFDIVVELDRSDVEFAPEFWASAHLARDTDRFLRRLIGRISKEARIRSIRFVVSGIMVGSIAFSSYMALYASAEEYLSLGYLYAGTTSQQISYVQRTGGAVDTAAPGYFDINADGSLNLDNLKTQVIAALQSDGVRVTPFLSNHWDRQKGKAALQNMEALTDQIAEAVALYNLDGVQVDIENLTEAQRSDYVAFVALLRQKLGWGKELSVAVAANPKGSSTGWAGSYNYAALAQYADYLVIMAYDEHYEGGEAGPVAGIEFVENAIRYALGQTSADKIVLGLPFYGRLWSADGRFVGNGINLSRIDSLLPDYGAAGIYDSTSMSMKAQFTVKASSPIHTLGGVTLKAGSYTLWYDNEATLARKMALVEAYGLRGAACWSLGQEPVSLWANYLGYLYAATPVPEIGAPASSVPASSTPASSAPASSAPASSVPASSTPASSAPTSSVPASSAAAEPTPAAEAPSAPELSSIPVEPEEPALIPSDPAQSQQSSVSAEEAPLSPPQDAPESGALGWVAAVSLLALPAVGAAVLATLKPGQRLRILKRVKGGWLKVRLQSGQEGYIPEALVSGPEEDAQGALT